MSAFGMHAPKSKPSSVQSQEREGRRLKLLSGAMMTGLGLMLLLCPEGLSDALISLSVIVAALALTGLAVMVEALYQSRVSR